MAGQVLIRPVRRGDRAAWEAMRTAMWPEGASEHGSEIARFFAGLLPELEEVLLAEAGDAGPIAVVELSIGTDVPGLEGVRTGYVEGLYIRREFRHSGLAGKLLRQSRSWAREKGCVAFASDRRGRILVDSNGP